MYCKCNPFVRVAHSKKCTFITILHNIIHYLRVQSVFLTEIVKLSSHPQVFDSVLLSSHSSLYIYYKMNMYSSMLVWLASKASINTPQINYLKSRAVCLIQSEELHSVHLSYHTCLIMNKSMIMKPNLLHFQYCKLPKTRCSSFRFSSN